ncbi:MAG: hypothetical protein ACI84R_002371 [Candidatus Azotimanducaceae bacterium]|jgi:hypothetical protein
MISELIEGGSSCSSMCSSAKSKAELGVSRKNRVTVASFKALDLETFFLPRGFFLKRLTNLNRIDLTYHNRTVSKLNDKSSPIQLPHDGELLMSWGDTIGFLLSQCHQTH